MDEDLHQRALEIFDEVCDATFDDRESLLGQRCKGNEELRLLVLRLLEADIDDDPLIPLGRGPEILAAGISEEGQRHAPARIGRYRVLRELGRGGMGVVYEAQQDEPSRRVAIKVTQQFASLAGAERRFRREWQLLGRLQHPGIAQVFEAGVTDIDGIRSPYFVMEFIDGQPIDEYVDGHELSTDQRVELIARVCDAVHHAHQRGVLHRDIKPANVLVIEPQSGTRAGTDMSEASDAIGLPKIVDFGIARLLDIEGDDTQHTQAGQIIGSLSAMSPEQLAGDVSLVDTRTDVYAIGAVLFRLLSGSSPYDLSKLSIPQAAQLVAERPAPALSSLHASIARDLSLIVAKALDRDPKLRYESAVAFADDLRRYRRDEAIEARHQARWYRASKFIKRHRIGVLAGGAAVLAVLAAAIIAIWFGVLAIGAEREAIKTAEAAEIAAYKASLSAAAAALREGDASLARNFLLEAPSDQRGWEWRYFLGQLDASVSHGEREAPWTGETANFVRDDTWLDDSGERLFSGTRYLSQPKVIESFRTESLQSDGAWTVRDSERVLGITGRGLVAVLHDEEAREIVGRDASTGVELWRERISPTFGITWTSYSRMPQSTVDGLIQSEFSRHESRSVEDLQEMVFDSSFGRWASASRLRAITGTLGGSSSPHVLVDVREPLYDAAFSPDDELIVFATLDRRLMVYKAGARELLWELDDAHTDAILCVAFDPSSELLASSGQDRIIRFWDARTGHALGRLIGHKETVLSLSFSADGATLFSTDGSGVRRWAVSDAFDSDIVARHGTFVGGVTLSPDGRTLVSHVANSSLPGAPTDEILLSTLGANASPQNITLPADVLHVVDVEFIDDGTVAVLAAPPTPPGRGLNATDLLVIDLSRAQDTRRVELESPGDLTLQVDGDIVFVVGSTSAAYDARTLDPVPWPSGRTWIYARPEYQRYGGDGEVVTAYSSSEELVQPFCIDEPRSRVFFATRSGGVQVADLYTGEPLFVIGGIGDTIGSLAAHPDGTRLFIGLKDTTIRVVDLRTSMLVAVLRGHRDSVRALTLSRDGTTLFSASDDYTVRRWDAATGQQIVVPETGTSSTPLSGVSVLP